MAGTLAHTDQPGRSAPCISMNTRYGDNHFAMSPNISDTFNFLLRLRIGRWHNNVNIPIPLVCLVSTLCGYLIIKLSFPFRSPPWNTSIKHLIDPLISSRAALFLRGVVNDVVNGAIDKHGVKAVLTAAHLSALLALITLN